MAGAQNLLCHPHFIPGVLGERIEIAVEGVRPRDKESKINTKRDEEDFSCVLLGKGPLVVDDRLDAAMAEQREVPRVRECIEEVLPDLLGVAVHSDHVEEFQFHLCVDGRGVKDLFL